MTETQTETPETENEGQVAETLLTTPPEETKQEEENKKDIPMVDIDTAGPGADVELEEQKPEGEVETKEEDSSSAPQAEETREEKAEGSDAQPEAEKKQEEKPEQKKEELETYSKDVQRRIAKLTKKWREAQRQADEALKFAKNQKRAKRKTSKEIFSN